MAINVLRPNVCHQVSVDLCVLLRAGDSLSGWVPQILPVSRVDWAALLAGLAKGLWEEVDLSGEAQRQTRFRNNMESVPRVFVPKVVAYNRDVMISEWVGGTPLRSMPSTDRRLKEAQALMRMLTANPFTSTLSFTLMAMGKVCFGLGIELMGGSVF